MNYKKELPYAYWLHNIKGVGNKGIRKLLSKEEKPSKIFRYSKEEMYKLYVKEEKVFTERAIEYIENSKKEWDVTEEYKKLEKKGIAFYPSFHPDYPERMKEIPDAPWAIYVIGKLPEKDRLTVAVVGARECSAYGAYVAKELGRTLARNGIQLVSGMAKGIDSLAQWAALEEGEAYGILGSGVDVCYPAGSRGVYEKMMKNGGIISEYPPGTEPKACNFPARNRIISGFSQIVVVVEAKEKSGTLITVDMALEQGKEVYVVPGRITDSLSIGCNQLIRQGACVLCSIEAFVKEIEETYVNCKTKAKMSQKEKVNVSIEQMEKWEEEILENVDYYPKTLQKIYDEVMLKCLHEDVPQIQEVIKGLVNLEKNGKIHVEGGCYYIKS